MRAETPDRIPDARHNGNGVACVRAKSMAAVALAVSLAATNGSFGEPPTPGTNQATSAPAAKNPPSTNAGKPPLVSVWIRRSTETKETTSGVNIATSKSYATVDCRAKRLSFVLSTLLNLHKQRFELGPGVQDELYDIKYECNSSDSLQVLIDSVLLASGCKLVDVHEERDVWIARLEKPSLPVSNSRGASLSPDGAGNWVARNVQIGRVLNFLEGFCDVLIEDQTASKDHLDLSWKDSKDFAQIRAELNKKYGIVFVRERKKVRIVRAVSASPRK